MVRLGLADRLNKIEPVTRPGHGDIKALLEMRGGLRLSFEESETIERKTMSRSLPRNVALSPHAIRCRITTSSPKVSSAIWLISAACLEPAGRRRRR